MLSSKKVIYTPSATNANRHTPNLGKTLQYQGSLGVSKPQANRCQTARENATTRSTAPIRPVYRRHIAGSCYTPKHKPNTSQTPANPYNPVSCLTQPNQPTHTSQPTQHKKAGRWNSPAPGHTVMRHSRRGSHHPSIAMVCFASTAGFSSGFGICRHSVPSLYEALMSLSLTLSPT